MGETVIALAGRRIDAQNAETARFPLESVGVVRERVTRVLRGKTALVCSAACGADLIALEQACTLHIRRRVVLPYTREQFRKTSVVDRPGEWGALFDRTLDEVEEAGDLVVLPYGPGDEQAYARANAEILGEAGRIANADSRDVLAVIVWDGKPRGSDDLTAAFRDEARLKGYAILEIPTR